MEQFLLTPSSVYNKSLNTQSVKKLELPKYQPSQDTTHKILSCPRIKLTNLQTLISDAVGTGSFLLDFAQHLCRKNADVPDIYFTLLDAADKSESECQS